MDSYLILHDFPALAAQRFALTGAGAGVDSAWEQRKLEVRKMLDAKSAAESPASSACFISPLYIDQRPAYKNFTRLQTLIIRHFMK